jgi:hypothetical protein
MSRDLRRGITNKDFWKIYADERNNGRWPVVELKNGGGKDRFACDRNATNRSWRLEQPGTAEAGDFLPQLPDFISPHVLMGLLAQLGTFCTRQGGVTLRGQLG